VTPISLPESGGIELRLVSLAVGETELARLRSLLSAEELQRGNRLLDRVRWERFFARRGMLREMLAELLSLEPRDVRLDVGEFGKLQIAADQNPASIRFNLSHAADLMLIAVAVGDEVGVDLEEVRQETAYRPMVERYFSALERKELFSLEPAEQLSAFYRCWTRKEAYLKGTGTGFSQPSTCFDVTLMPGLPPALVGHRGSPAEITRWRIEDVAVPAGYCAALAVEKSDLPSGTSSPTGGV
jgi:4'-phosphopantetheinyl transferase